MSYQARESFGSKSISSNYLGGEGSNSLSDYKNKAAEIGASALTKASYAKDAALDWLNSMTKSNTTGES